MKYLLLPVSTSLQLFALLGFVVSAGLISAAASEVVSLLHMLGVVLSLSNTVLGLTLLAWGNSIGGDTSKTNSVFLFFAKDMQNLDLYIKSLLFFRLFFWHHHRSPGLPTDGHISLLRRHYFQYPYFYENMYASVKRQLMDMYSCGY